MNYYLDSAVCVVTGRASKYEASLCTAIPTHPDQYHFSHAAQHDCRDGIQAFLPPYLPLKDQTAVSNSDDRGWAS